MKNNPAVSISITVLYTLISKHCPNAKASVDRQFKLHNEVRLIPATLLSLDVKLDLTYSPLDLSHQMFNVGFKSEQKSNS